ncbi:hypothetical protein SD77_1770 [Bacillus badius]|uniref:Uncharacterized protein n=1 Tax=Bacillus badius TaxID=1455 RepID=A0ABR5AQY7_BACBA|nr:hypothetical protein SD78_4250 [Bacillus badius]KIL77165.1 hypothetical protein SD77_1770 [Bacillus badius]
MTKKLPPGHLWLGGSPSQLFLAAIINSLPSLQYLPAGAR